MQSESNPMSSAAARSTATANPRASTGTAAHAHSRRRNQNRQTIGQFAPSVPEWGLPPFSGATQSLRVFEEGSLLVDVTSAASSAIVWRGLAQAEVHRGRTPEEREVRLRAAIADLFKKFPKTS